MNKISLQKLDLLGLLFSRTHNSLRQYRIILITLCPTPRPPVAQLTGLFLAVHPELAVTTG